MKRPPRNITASVQRNGAEGGIRKTHYRLVSSSEAFDCLAGCMAGRMVRYVPF